MLSDRDGVALTTSATTMHVMHFRASRLCCSCWWCSDCSRLLAAEKMDRTSVQRRFFEQQRGQPGGAAAPSSSLGAAGASTDARGRGVTRATSGAAEAHSSRRDVLASLDLLALSSDGSKRGHPALPPGARRPSGGTTVERTATLPDRHRSKRRRSETRVDALPSQGEPVVAQPPGWNSEERNIGKRPLNAVTPTMSERVVRQRTEASGPSVPGLDASPSFETHDGQSLYNRFQPQQLSSGGEMHSPRATRRCGDDAELGGRYLRGHTPSSSTAVLDYRRRAPLSSQPSQADNWGVPAQASLAANLPQPSASSPRPSAGGHGTRGPPLSFCFSSRPGRGSALASSSAAAGLEVRVTRDAGADAGSRDDSPLAAAALPETGRYLSTSGERGQLGELDAVHTASASDSLRVAPRSLRQGYPEAGDAHRLGSFREAPISRLPSPSHRLLAGRQHLSDQPRTLGAHPVRTAHAYPALGCLADDGPVAAGVCPRPSSCVPELGRAASSAGDGPRDRGSRGRDLSPLARTLSSNPSTGSSGYGVYAVKQSGLRVCPIAPSALSAELGALERKILGNADEDIGSAFQVAPRASAAAAGVLRPGDGGRRQPSASTPVLNGVVRSHQGAEMRDGASMQHSSTGLLAGIAVDKAGGASCSDGAGPEDDSSGRPSSSSRRGASTSSRSVSNPLASTSCPLDASLAEAL